jgi:hypothetical protein
MGIKYIYEHIIPKQRHKNKSKIQAMETKFLRSIEGGRKEHTKKKT